MLDTRFAWRNPCSVNPIASITRSAEAMKAESSSLVLDISSETDGGASEPGVGAGCSGNA